MVTVILQCDSTYKTTPTKRTQIQKTHKIIQKHSHYVLPVTLVNTRTMFKTANFVTARYSTYNCIWIQKNENKKNAHSNVFQLVYNSHGHTDTAMLELCFTTLYNIDQWDQQQAVLRYMTFHSETRRESFKLELEAVPLLWSGFVPA